MNAGKCLLAKALLMMLAFDTAASECRARALIKADDQTVLSTELAAKVTELPVRPGASFKEGDLLVGLDCALYQAQKLKVEAEKKAASIKLDNTKKLNQLRSVGAIEVALAQAQLDQMEASLRIAHLNAERCTIRAPYDGKVIEHRINRFETVSQQQEVIEIVSDQQLKAEVIAPARWLQWLKKGTSTKLYADGSRVMVEGSVTAISPAIDPTSQTIVLHIEIPSHSGLIPGMSATAELSCPDTQPTTN